MLERKLFLWNIYAVVFRPCEGQTLVVQFRLLQISTFRRIHSETNVYFLTPQFAIWNNKLVCFTLT